MEDIVSKKRKKLLKRAERGDIINQSMFQECNLAGISVKPSISIWRDPSRVESTHKLNLDEIRDLLLCFIDDKPPSRYFHIKNKGAIRYIGLLHISDCDALEELDLREVCPASSIVRVSRQTSEVLHFSRHLLTTSTEGGEAQYDNKKSVFTTSASGGSFAQYVLNESSMRLWSYPMPCIGEVDTIPVKVLPLEDDEEGKDLVDATTSDEPSFKKSKLADEANYDRVEGTYAWTVPASAEDADSLLTSIPPVRVADLTGRVYNDFRETLFATAEAYQALLRGMDVPSSSIPTGSSLVNVLAVDCEMCDTAEGLELTRLSLVSQYGVLLLDMFIKPRSPITNYRSQWSGITSEIMESVTHTIAQAQVAFLRLVSKETTLIGHSVDSDLKALKICHSSCVDTAILYPHPKNFPFRNKLKFLANKYLNMQIQNHAGSGHDSIEDARAAVQLVNLKIEKGPSFGMPKASNRTSLFLTNQKCLSTFAWTNEDDPKHMRECLAYSSQVFYHSEAGSSTQMQEVQTYIRDTVSVFPLFSIQYLGAKWENVEALKTQIQQYSTTLSGAFAPGSHGLLIVTCQRSLQPIYELMKRKRACSSPMSACAWSKKQEEDLQNLIKETHYCKIGMSIIS